MLYFGFLYSGSAKYPHATVLPHTEVLGSNWLRDVIETHFPDFVVAAFHAGYENSEMEDTVLGIKKIVAEVFSGYNVPIHVVTAHDHRFYSGPCQYNTTDTQCYCVDA